MTDLFGLLEEAIACENGGAAQQVATEIVGTDGELVDCLLDKERRRYNRIVRDNMRFFGTLGILPVRK